MKIVFTDSFTMNPGDLDWSIFKDFGEIEIHEFTSNSDLLERVQEANIIVSNKTILSNEVLKECKDLQLICVSATGYNNVDVSFAAEIGVPVCNAADYSSSSVAQHVFASILSVYNKISFYSNTVHNGRWQKSRDFTYYDEPIEELTGKSIGIIGYGNIGKSVAKIARAFGMNVLVLAHPSRNIQEDDVHVLQVIDFLNSSDIISIHVPLRPSTKNMVNETFLKNMKDSAILVNTARGPIIEESALRVALENNWIRAACIDVMSTEPPKESILFGLKNCIITPHQAWASKQSRNRLMRIVADNIRSFQQGQLQNQVN